MNKTYVIEPSRSPFGEHTVELVGTVQKLLMTCGGGMGGSRWEEFGAITGDIYKDSFITLTEAVTGNKRDINTRFIVEAEEKKLYKVITDITPHVNYSSKRCKKATEVVYYWLDKGDTAVGSKNRNTLAGNKALESHIVYQETIME